MHKPPTPEATSLFQYSFTGARSVLARRHINPDGREGGTVAAEAKVDPSAIVMPTALVWPGATVGAGTRLEQGVRIARDAVVGAAAFLFQNVHVGTHAKVGSGTLVGFGCDIGTSAVIGAMTNIGAGVKIADGVKIGDNVVIEKGAQVTQHVPDGAVVGVAAPPTPPKPTKKAGSMPAKTAWAGKPFWGAGTAQGHRTGKSSQRG